MKAADPPDTSEKTTRFQEKRERILDAAANLVNEHGLKGMTLVDVAQAVDLNTTSVTYYFKRKELLAAAAFERTLDRIEDMVREAGKEATPRARVAAYVHANFTYRRRLRQGRERPITVLSDMRAMDDDTRLALADRYRGIITMIRDFFGPAETEKARALSAARAHVLIENMFWMPAWITRYSVPDFARVEQRLLQIFDSGIALPGAVWTPQILDIRDEEADGDGGKANFLRAATRLINERGYRGASVERIASELNVTKGSFYHHLDAKDDLVLSCFDTSYTRVSRAQRAANETIDSCWDRLTGVFATLLQVQFQTEFPLLRTTALQALPVEMRARVMDRSNRMARRFAGMMIDGITAGEVKTIDPLIASQMIMAMLNAAFELRRWAQGLEPDTAIRYYASTLAYGLYDDPPEG